MHSIIRYVVNEIKLHCNLRLELGKRASKQQPRAGKQVANSDVIAASPGPVPSLPCSCQPPKFPLSYC
jgi:hypothetical protein